MKKKNKSLPVAPPPGLKIDQKKKDRVAAVLGTMVGLLTITEGGRVLLGLMVPDYPVLSWLVWYNVAMGAGHDPACAASVPASVDPVEPRFQRRRANPQHGRKPAMRFLAAAAEFPAVLPAGIGAGPCGGAEQRHLPEAGKFPGDSAADQHRDLLRVRLKARKRVFLTVQQPGEIL